MKIRICTILFAFFVMLSPQAQSQDDKVLFTVNNKGYTSAEFLRVYNKNLDLVQDESQKDIDQYLELYINYALKLAEAYELGYDKKPEYIREFNTYKKQLSKNYLSDRTVTEALVKEAYDRISQDVKASHILIRIPETETDTSQVYSQIMALRERLINEDFENLRKELHNGNSIFVEDLGWFSGFKMVYNFETAAFNTPVGEVSMPFRTQFGYHVVKVLDKRKSRGEVTVSHIFLQTKEKDSSDPAARIQEIYKMLKSGQNFEDLAKQFSEDKSSSAKGGQLNPFKSGQLSSTRFEDVAFSLQKADEISEPFESEFGWHIVKLIKKAPIAPFDEMRRELETRVRRDSRSKVINEAMVSKLKKRYGVNDDIDLSIVVNSLNDDFFSGKWMLPEDFPGETVLFKIGDTAFTFSEFGDYLQGNQKRIRERQSFEGVASSLFNSFLNEKLLAYYENNLEHENPEFAQVLTEYRDGLLLFDLMEDQVWNAVKEDSVGLKTYFEKNKEKYRLPEQINAVIVSSSDNDMMSKIREELLRGVEIDSLKSKYNSETKGLIFTDGIFSKGDRRLPSDFSFEPGVSDLFNMNNNYHVVHVSEVLPSRIPEFEDSKGRVIGDYQIEFEKQWIDGLKQKFNVKVNQEVFDNIKAKLKR